MLRGWRQVAAVQAPALLGQAALLGPHTECTEAQTRLHTGKGPVGSAGHDLSVCRDVTAGCMLFPAGDSIPLPPPSKKTTVRALTGCAVWRLAAADLAALLADDPALLRQLAKAYLEVRPG